MDVDDWSTEEENYLLDLSVSSVDVSTLVVILENYHPILVRQKELIKESINKDLLDRTRDSSNKSLDDLIKDKRESLEIIELLEQRSRKIKKELYQLVKEFDIDDSKPKPKIIKP